MFDGGFETIVENELDVINLFCIKRIRCEINLHIFIWRVIKTLYFKKKKHILLLHFSDSSVS